MRQGNANDPFHLPDGSYKFLGCTVIISLWMFSLLIITTHGKKAKNGAITPSLTPTMHTIHARCYKASECGDGWGGTNRQGNKCSSPLFDPRPLGTWVGLPTARQVVNATPLRGVTRVLVVCLCPACRDLCAACKFTCVCLFVGNPVVKI